MKRSYLQKAKHQVARSKTIRGINRQIVLKYVRERSPIPRAEISRETTFNVQPFRRSLMNYPAICDLSACVLEKANIPISPDVDFITTQMLLEVEKNI